MRLRSKRRLPTSSFGLKTRCSSPLGKRHQLTLTTCLLAQSIVTQSVSLLMSSARYGSSLLISTKSNGRVAENEAATVSALNHSYTLTSCFCKDAFNLTSASIRARQSLRYRTSQTHQATEQTCRFTLCQKLNTKPIQECLAMRSMMRVCSSTT